MKSLIFHKRYHKLSQSEFTTIRGATAAARYKVGNQVELILQEHIESPLGVAEIVSVEQMSLREMSLELLKADGEYPGFVIHSNLDFMGLLNHFRRFNKLKSLDDVLTVIKLKMVTSLTGVSLSSKES